MTNGRPVRDIAVPDPGARGVAAVEFALVVPLLVILLFNHLYLVFDRASFLALKRQRSIIQISSLICTAHAIKNLGILFKYRIFIRRRLHQHSEK